MSETSLNAAFRQGNAAPTISWSTLNVLIKVEIETSRKEAEPINKMQHFCYSRIHSLNLLIDDYKKSERIDTEQQIKRNPIRAKVISLLSASVIIGIIIAGALGAYCAFKLVSEAQGLNGGIGGLIIIGTVVVANVAGAYFTYKWGGPLPEGDDYALPLIMSFIGMATPIWRAFGNCSERSFEAVRKNYDEETHRAMIQILDSQPPSTEITQAKRELETVYDYFSKNKIEMDQLEEKSRVS